MSIVKCDNCNSEINQEIKTKKFGNIEIKYLYCDECCNEYTISVTDTKLRTMINEEKHIQEQIKQLHEASYQEYKLCTREKQKKRVLKQANKSQNKLMKKHNELKLAIREYHDKLKKQYEI